MLDLQELEAIKRLKYKYMRCLDQKLWDGMAECLTDDCTTRYSNGKYSFDSRDEALKFFRESMDSPSVMSSHRVHQPEIDFQDATHATGTWAMEDVFIDEAMGITIRGAAFYEDRYVKIDGEWKIAHTGYKRTFEEMENRKENKLLSMLQRATD